MSSRKRIKTKPDKNQNEGVGEHNTRMRARTVNPSTAEWRQDYQEFKIILSYMVSWRPT